MAFTGNYSCNTLRSGLVNGTINFATDTFYLALYTNSATLDQSTTGYTTAGEVVGTGYTAGGATLTITVPPTTGGTGHIAYLAFADVSWPAATFTTRGALIYKADGLTNPAVVVLDFGSDKSPSGATFTVQFPAVSNTSAIIRIAQGS